MVGAPLILVERTLNRYISESSVAQDVLQSLDGNSMCVVVEGLGFALSFTADGEEILVTTSDPATATVIIRGTPLNFLSVFGSKSLQALTKAGVELEGDAEVASAFWKLLRAARPDLEEELSHIVGDVLAHQIGKTVKNLGDYGRRVFSALQMNTTEYLQEEARQLPPRLEIEGFFSSLEQLRDDVERTEYRITRLEKT
ncbi:MAG: SCP2 sterol-binding domain-containing protein [Gammaproteobacteria bacterium]